MSASAGRMAALWSNVHSLEVLLVSTYCKLGLVEPLELSSSFRVLRPAVPFAECFYIPVLSELLIPVSSLPGAPFHSGILLTVAVLEKFCQDSRLLEYATKKAGALSCVVLHFSPGAGLPPAMATPSSAHDAIGHASGSRGARVCVSSLDEFQGAFKLSNIWVRACVPYYDPTQDSSHDRDLLQLLIHLQERLGTAGLAGQQAYSLCRNNCRSFSSSVRGPGKHTIQTFYIIAGSNRLALGCTISVLMFATYAYFPVLREVWNGTRPDKYALIWAYWQILMIAFLVFQVLLFMRVFLLGLSKIQPWKRFTPMLAPAAFMILQLWKVVHLLGFTLLPLPWWCLVAGVLNTLFLGGWVYAHLCNHRDELELFLAERDHESLTIEVGAVAP